MAVASGFLSWPSSSSRHTKDFKSRIFKATCVGWTASIKAPLKAEPLDWEQVLFQFQSNRYQSPFSLQPTGRSPSHPLAPPSPSPQDCSQSILLSARKGRSVKSCPDDSYSSQTSLPGTVPCCREKRQPVPLGVCCERLKDTEQGLPAAETWLWLGLSSPRASCLWSGCVCVSGVHFLCPAQWQRGKKLSQFVAHVYQYGPLFDEPLWFAALGSCIAVPLLDGIWDGAIIRNFSCLGSDINAADSPAFPSCTAWLCSTHLPCSRGSRLQTGLMLGLVPPSWCISRARHPWEEESWRERITHQSTQLWGLAVQVQMLEEERRTRVRILWSFAPGCSAYLKSSVAPGI